jgi:hypothetical protein
LNTALRTGEQLLKSGRANLRQKVWITNGILNLTTERLIFEAHIFNVQGGGRATEFNLEDVQGLEKCWTKQLGIPLVPNSIMVRTTHGDGVRFVVFGRGAWAAAINEQVDRCRRQNAAPLISTAAGQS